MKRGGIRQVEESIDVLRSQPMRVWLQYLAGAVPFLLVILWFLRDMSTGYLADRCAFEALLCTLTFFWHAAWKARFSASLLASMQGAQVAPQCGLGRVFYRQSVLQALKLVTLPFAVISMIPFVWTSLFFRSAAIEAGQNHAALSAVFAKSFQRASYEGRTAWVGYAILNLVSLVLFINLFALIVGLPGLVKSLTGYEGESSRYLGGMLSFPTFRVIAALSWLGIDPLFQSFAVVRCFYSEARIDGRDLLARLRPMAALFLLFAAGTVHLNARDMQQAGTVPDQRISRAIKDAARSQEYAWLHPTKPSESSLGFLDRLSHDLDKVGEFLRTRVRQFNQWLRKLLRRTSTPDMDEGTTFASKSVNTGPMMYVLLAIVVLALIIWFVRAWLSHPKDAESISAAEVAMRDVASEHVLASDLPHDEWLQMAQDLLAKGEARLAVRAMYLSNLAYLGALQMIRIARSKSNSIYERELTLRPGVKDACAPFAQANRNFERVWYGFHEATPEFVADFQKDVEAVRSYVKA